jgi:hypothetical protein
VRVVVAAMDSMMTWWLVRGRPFQFMVMRENSRCSIWGEMRTSGGARQLAGAEPGLTDCAGGYAVAASSTV